MIRNALHLALIVGLVLTAIGLGAARGTVMLQGQIVLCTGQGIVIMDDPRAAGDTLPHASLCPDMALSLLAAVDVAVPGIAPVNFMGRSMPPIPIKTAHGRESPGAKARDPPSGQS